MPFGSLINTGLFVVMGAGGLFIGWSVIEWISPDISRFDSEPTSTEERQVSVNIAILYATLTLVISSIVSQWPPEGQSILPIVEEMVFFVSVLIVATIVGRVAKLIYKLEMNP